MTRRIIYCFMALITAAMLLTACGGPVTLTSEESESLDGLTVKVEKAEIEKNKKAGTWVFSIDYKLANSSDKEVTEVISELTFYDKAGNELVTVHPRYNSLNTLLMPEGTADAYYGFQKELPGTPKSCTARVESYKTVEDLPPLHLPVPGEPLYRSLNNENLASIDTEPPVEIILWIDEMGDRRTAEITDKETIRELTELFTAITIGEEPGEAVTDNYNGVTFVFADGSTATVNLLLKSLEVEIYDTYYVYSLENFDLFWQAMNELTKSES